MTPESSTRCIIHADLDAFYASVEQMDRPELQGKPVVVGGSPSGRGVVASCSYEARKYGVRSAMPMGRALRLCPQAIRVSPRFDRYGEVSREVMAVFHSVTPLVEPMSMDEAYLDVSNVVRHGIPPVEIARLLKLQVKGKTGLTISVGCSTSKTVSKIASDLEKPDGLVIVEPGQEREFLAPLPVLKIPGIGPSSERRLSEKGVVTIGDLARQTEPWAREVFGKRGPVLLTMARGEDLFPVVTEHSVKSVSAEDTFGADTSDPDELAQRISDLCQRVASRLQKSDLKGRTITVKLRLADFTTFTRSMTLPSPVHEPEDVRQAAMHLLNKELAPDRKFRLLGVGVSNFGESDQLSLFDTAPGEQSRVAL